MAARLARLAGNLVDRLVLLAGRAWLVRGGLRLAAVRELIAAALMMDLDRVRLTAGVLALAALRGLALRLTHVLAGLAAAG